MTRLLLPLFLAALCFSSAAADERPNFILINCDDLGYADIGPFGAERHRTPHLDRMAAEGRKFTSFYVTSGVCSPSRSSLMTGCYPKRIGLHQNEHGKWVLFPGDQRGLNPSEITVAEVLKEAGYQTAMVGKWHLGDQPEFLPTRQGFDSYFGIPFSNDMGRTDRPDKRYPPLPLLRDETVIEKEPDQHFITQRYTEEAIAFLEKAAKKDSPFFLYLPHTMPHWPQYSSPSFEGKSANGAWGDAVEEIDWSVGQILDKLSELGVDENTLVIFTSDNGGAMNHGASNAPLRGAKGSTLEGAQRVCTVMRWPAKIPAGSVCDELATTLDILPTFAHFGGGTVPSDRIIDGKNIAPLLLGEAHASTPHEAFYYYKLGGLQCVRSGPWKLHLARTEKPRNKPNAKGRKVPAALYHLDNDIGEEKNVASEHPEVVARLESLAEKARADLGDDATGTAGKGTRKPGDVPGAVPLTSD